MNNKTRKAIASGKGRTVYYLTEEEAAVIDKMRADKKDATRRAKLYCAFLPGDPFNCRANAERDGYCLKHWNVIEQMKRQRPASVT